VLYYKVLVLSGYPADGFPAQILHEGREGFLQKPFAPPSLS
jgi:hypothetical protein